MADCIAETLSVSADAATSVPLPPRSSFIDLPIALQLYICRFLNCKELWCCLAPTCREYMGLVHGPPLFSGNLSLDPLAARVDLNMLSPHLARNSWRELRSLSVRGCARISNYILIQVD